MPPQEIRVSATQSQSGKRILSTWETVHRAMVIETYTSLQDFHIAEKDRIRKCIAASPVAPGQLAILLFHDVESWSGSQDQPAFLKYERVVFEEFKGCSRNEAGEACCSCPGAHEEDPAAWFEACRRAWRNADLVYNRNGAFS
eukprot:1085042-Pyramimonas_sp.AAC.1